MRRAIEHHSGPLVAGEGWKKKQGEGLGREDREIDLVDRGGRQKNEREIDVLGWFGKVE